MEPVSVPIIFDEELDRNMIEFFDTVQNVTEFNGNAALLCILTPIREDAIVLRWACDTDDEGEKVPRSTIQNVPFSNNLQTLVEVNEEVKVHPKVAFAALNCIRKSLSCLIVVVDPEDIKTGTARVYVVPT